jgi:hypothetical protein
MKTNLLLQTGLFLVFCVVVWQFGFRLAISDSVENTVEVQEPRAAISALPKSTEAEREPARQTESSEAKGESDVDVQFNHFVSKNGLQQKRELLKKVFGQGEMGNRLVSVATLIEFGIRARTDEAKFLENQIRYLESHPVETLNELQQNLSKLAPEFNRERRFMIEMASRLEVNSTIKMEFLSNELKNAAMDPEPKNQSYFNGIIALQGLLKESSDPIAVENALREALKNQTEPNARFFLIAAYEEKEPQRAQKFK